MSLFVGWEKSLVNGQGSNCLYAGWIVAIGRDGRHCCYHVAVPVAVIHVAKTVQTNHSAPTPYDQDKTTSTEYQSRPSDARANC